MDYVEIRLNEFIENTKPFIHELKSNVPDYENYLSEWNKKFLFYPIMLEIFDFIESEPFLIDFVNKKNNKINIIIKEQKFIDAVDSLFNVIKNSWFSYIDINKRDADFISQYKKLKDFMECDQETSTHLLSVNKEPNLQDILNKDKYFKITNNHYPLSNISKLIKQYVYMCLPANISQENKKIYKKNIEILKEYKDKIRKEHLESFYIFYIFTKYYKEYKLSDTYEDYGDLQCESYEIYSTQIVNSTITVLKDIMNYYRKNKDKYFDKEVKPEQFTEEEIFVLRQVKQGISLEKIGNKLNPKRKSNNMKQLSLKIRTKLNSVKNISDAVRIFEENYYKL